MRSRAALVVACAAVVGLAGAAFAIRAAGNGKPAALTAPGCSTAVAAAQPLAKVHSASVLLSGKPYAVAVTRDGQWTFVTLGQSVAVMKNGGSLAPTLARVTSVPNANGEALTHRRRFLGVASGSGWVVQHVAPAGRGGAGAVVWDVVRPGGPRGDRAPVAII